MQFARICASIFATATVVLADVAFSIPAPGDSYPGGTPFQITWADSGTAPLITALGNYDLVLYTGTNAAPVELLVVATAQIVSSGAFTATIPLGIGGATANAYFLGMKSTVTAGGIVINYSSRFTLTGMTGVFADPIPAQLATVVGTDGPPTVIQAAAVSAAAALPVGPIDPLSFSMSFYLQTGPTRFAPMESQPPTAIAAGSPGGPLNPTSPFVLATTFLPPALVQTTITQGGRAASFASHPNTQAGAPQPTDPMQKFLNRWKD